jgi:Taurine catabolism dioxygenase TauD, TfdA family
MPPTVEIPSVPFRGPQVWSRAGVEHDPSSVAVLPAEGVADLDAALAGLRANRRTLETVGPADFPFPRLGPWLKRFVRTPLSEGIGFGMIRGFPLERCTDDEAGMLFWGMGTHMGLPVSQNAMGHRLGHVFDQGKDYEALNVRGYQTSHRLNYHTDSSDLVGLMCLRRARTGGLSSVACAHAVFNTLLAESPQHLPVLFRGFEYDRRGSLISPWNGAASPRPVFAIRDGQLSCGYVRQPIKTARIKTGVPFSDAEHAALDAFDEAASRPANTFSVMLEPGDIQFCNNHLVLHSRTEYEDWPEPGRERHMLRLWLKVDDIRALDDAQIGLDAGTGWSRREGILPRGMTMRDGRLVET